MGSRLTAHALGYAGESGYSGRGAHATSLMRNHGGKPSLRFVHWFLVNARFRFYPKDAAAKHAAAV